MATLMLPIKSNRTVSKYDTVPLDFTGSIKVSNLRMGTQNSDFLSREFLAFLGIYVYLLLIKGQQGQSDEDSATYGTSSGCETLAKMDYHHQHQMKGSKNGKNCIKVMLIFQCFFSPERK